MSDDPILAALARLEAGQKALADRIDGLQGYLHDRFDRIEGRLNQMDKTLACVGSDVKNYGR